ncbi:methyl-accepting chemotaxis protein [Photobacterium sp. BZF1]|uniref:CHASE3 domain-containing protein n=1 Tax=Photobacterium sp. BZF1 TaxID=1904457 RepID=UPI00165382C9|nr:CHASE3 domain-containing protein [Photobacterium sp. BZF1]MBC7005248.1 methyl-accepting chemotaxis protein [Photobacterium sp. BZF1]
MDFSNLSIRARLLLINSVISLMLLGLMGVVYNAISTMEKTSHWVEHTHEVIRQSEGLVSAMVDQETGLRGFAIAGQSDYLEPYQSGQKDFQENLTSVKQLTSDNPAQQQRFDGVEEQAIRWQAYAESVIALRNDIQSGEAVNKSLTELIASGVGKQKMDGIRQEIASMQLGFIGDEILNAMINMETGLRGFMLNRQESFLEPYLLGRSVIAENSSTIASTQLARDIEGWITSYAEPAIGLVREASQYKTMSDLYNLLAGKQGKIFMDGLRQRVDEIIQVEQALMTTRQAAALSSASLANNVIIFGGLTTLIITFIFAHLASKSITRPMDRAVEIAKQLAEGDLNVRFEKAGNNEIGTLLGAMQKIADNLKQMIGKVIATSEQLSDSSTQLTQTLDKTGSGAKEQLNQTDQIAVAMNQMSISVQEVAQNAVSAAHVASETDQEAKKGLMVIEETMGNIDKLDREITHTSTQLSNLVEETNNIGKILDVIGGIAEQTNLLALNAAIEAARAGEQGRGFAVVADEVRVLAQRTQESTTEIQSLIERLQGGTEEVVLSMSQSTELLKSTIDSASQSGAAFGTITQSISKINDMNTQSASASEQQSVTAEQVNKNMLTVNGISQESYEVTMSAVDSCKELIRLSKVLNEAVQKFKV